jgi:hypothetical protein
MGNLPSVGGLQHDVQVRESNLSGCRTSIDIHNSSNGDPVKDYRGLTPRRSIESQTSVGSSDAKPSINGTGRTADYSKNVHTHENTFTHLFGSKGISF